jgi:hypothetical protein
VNIGSWVTTTQEGRAAAVQQKVVRTEKTQIQEEKQKKKADAQLEVSA